MLVKGYKFHLLLMLIGFLVSSVAQAADIRDIRIWDSPDKTRVVFDLDRPVNYKVFELTGPNRVVIDIEDGIFLGSIPVSDKIGQRIVRIRTGRHENSIRFVLDLKSKLTSRHFALKPVSPHGNRLVVDLHLNSDKSDVATRTTDDEFIVVIDAGHGGEDPGAVGARKTREKDLVLKIAKQLEKQLNAISGIRAELTRKGDYYVPLRKRTRIATDLEADLFVSIHADAFTRRSAHGISVFALSQKGATSRRARELASKENASDAVAGVSTADRDRDVDELLTELSFKGQIDRSLSLGSMVRMRLSRVGRLHGDSVEQAGFVVLKAPRIPSILVEVGFISNPEEERKLNTPAYRTKIVKEITTGIVQYVKKYPWGQDGWRAAKN